MKIEEFRNVLEPEICETIIGEFTKCSIITRNRPEYSFKEVMMQNGTETMSKLQMTLVERASYYVNLYRLRNNIKYFPENFGFESVRVKRYDSCGDQFPWHVDVRDYESAKRFLVVMFYFNDNFTGGTTDFGDEDEIKLTIKPEQGKIVIFTPFWDNPHRGNQVKNGSKYIANVYLHYL